MENCGGGQRLPPDGDEFPAAYQEFGKEFDGDKGLEASMTMTMTMTMSATTMARTPAIVKDDPFLEKDGLKMLTIESNAIASRNIVLPGVANQGCQGVDGASGKNDVVATCRLTQPDDRRSLYVSEDHVKRNAPFLGYSTSYGKPANGNLEVSEKKLEITGYYHKDSPFIEEVLSRENEVSSDTPPPLPLTGPPKMDAIGAQAKNHPASEQSQRKFSLNGELWRQDDKSERSVRDKIAMFSSQSSLDAPLFPNATTLLTGSNAGGNTAKKLSKYKSSEDVCTADKIPTVQKEKVAFLAERNQSSIDTIDCAKKLNPGSFGPFGKPGTIHASKTFPVVSQELSLPESQTVTTKSVAANKSYRWTSAGQYDGTHELKQDTRRNEGGQLGTSNCLKTPGAGGLARATSFSGSTPYGQERGSNPNDFSSGGSQIARTNSLASAIRRPSEDIRKTSLNQLIEQRRKSISKLRGLVIPERDAVSIDQPIVDLPEIKSRDFIMLHQLPRTNLQDKWGSQSSLASNASATSVTPKTTASFKMPAPQISSKYSPAFKRKSLTIYGTSIPSSTISAGKTKNPPANCTFGTTSTTSTSTSTTTSAKNCAPVLSSSLTVLSTSTSTSASLMSSTPTTTLSAEPPKSLESICSPTRSDYSFDFVSASNSPEGPRIKGRTAVRKTRMDYDDSDNDSAVSSSQSSISRGFSPPMSPVPSERSVVSSERSYLSAETNYQRPSLIMDVSNGSNRTYDLAPKSNLHIERTYHTVERSPSSGGNSNPRSTQSVDLILRNSQIPQRQQIQRSNSTDTNCSTSSTLTSGSQASAESLSRRVLKPQSVEAINRKNILASARCRSGKELNGSPLIQRRFTEDETQSSLTRGSDGSYSRSPKTNQVYSKNIVACPQNVKVAYIEVTDSFPNDEESFRHVDEVEPKLPPKRSVSQPICRPPKSEMLEPSNDLKMWVRAEAKALKSRSNRIDSTDGGSVKRNGISSVVPSDPEPKEVVPVEDTCELECTRVRSRTNSTSKCSESSNDLLTILTTRTRSRSAIHVDDGTFGRSKSQMSLEEILTAKTDTKVSRAQSLEDNEKPDGKDICLGTESVRWTWKSKDTSPGSRSDLWSEEKSFVSKIPTLGRSRATDPGNETQPEINESSRLPGSKIPTAGKTLARRSASVTDMKKALERTESNGTLTEQRSSRGSTIHHSQFSSLDSSVDNVEESRMTSTLIARSNEPIPSGSEVERYCGEQFGSISSLASSTSLISQQELAQLVEEANIEEVRGTQDVIVVLLHKENPTGSVGITLAGGADCEVKEITVHRVLAHSIADRDGRVQRGDRILSINGRSTRSLTHRESLAVLKQPRSEVVLVVSRAKPEELGKLRSRTASVETIIEGFETNGVPEDTAWGPPSVVAVYKDGAGLGFSLEGGRDSPLGDRPLMIKKIFTGGAAEKTGALRAGDQLLEVNGYDVTRMSRIEAWSLMKKLHDGEVNLLVRHPATKSS